MDQAGCQGRMRHFPGPPLRSPFVMQIVMLIPAAGLVPARSKELSRSLHCHCTVLLGMGEHERS